MQETVHGITKARWDSLDADQQQQIEAAARELDELVTEALHVSDLDLFIEPDVPRPQHELWQRILTEQDQGLLPSQPDKAGIAQLEAQALAALSPDGLDLNAPVALDENECQESCCYVDDSCCVDGTCHADTAAPGDQPPPVKNDSIAIQSLVIADVEARLRVGIQRYGTPLQAFNGRDALWDAYQEALDLVVYLRQMIAERDGQ